MADLARRDAGGERNNPLPSGQASGPRSRLPVTPVGPQAGAQGPSWILARAAVSCRRNRGLDIGPHGRCSQDELLASIDGISFKLPASYPLQLAKHEATSALPQCYRSDQIPRGFGVRAPNPSGKLTWQRVGSRATRTPRPSWRPRSVQTRCNSSVGRSPYRPDTTCSRSRRCRCSACPCWEGN
jgi:hypothetical protein